MGTRAAFFVGDPRDVENREWLGCIAWDGFPEEFPQFADARTPEEFRGMVQESVKSRDDFADPEKGGFPFPWTDDLFLTDHTFAFFDGAAYVEMGRKWRTMKQVLEASEEEQDKWHDEPEDPSLMNVPAPTGQWDRSQPDSIMILTARE